MEIYAEERQQAIVERARAEGHVDVGELADIFTVHSQTIRRDLAILEGHGLLRRVHGGALSADRQSFESTVATRENVMTEEKARIADAAIAELPERGAILLDAGTTVGRLAEAIPFDRELTVVTNSVSTARALSVRPRLTVMLIGGRLRSRTLAAVDNWALRTLKEIYVEVAFIAANGISVEHGLTTPHSAEAQVKAAAMASARRTVVLADHTKVGREHFAAFADLSAVDTFITDRGIGNADASKIAAAGPTVVAA